MRTIANKQADLNCSTRRRQAGAKPVDCLPPAYCNNAHFFDSVIAVMSPPRFSMRLSSRVTFRVTLMGVLGSLLTAVNPALAQNWVARVVQPEKNQPLNTNGNYWSLTSVACSADGTKMIAAGGSLFVGGPVCVSTDLGANWRVVNLPTNVYWGGVASSADGTKLVAVEGSVYTSSDAGATWTPRNAAPISGPGFVNINAWYCIASSADGTKLVAGFNQGNTNPTNNIIPEGICLSSDSGATWQLSSLPGLWGAVASSADGRTLVALGAPPHVGQKAVYVSTDAGGSWRRANLPAVLLTYIALSGDGSTVVACGNNVYISTDSGNNWTQWTNAPQGPSGNIFWTAPAASANGKRLMVGAFGGGSPGTIYTSDDSGATWQSTNNAISGAGGFLSASASSADGRELIAIPRGEVYAFTLQAPLVASISVTPQRVHTGDSIQVVVNVINNDPNHLSVSNVQLDGAVEVAGKGGVSLAGSSGPTLVATLAPGTTASFTNLYTATNYGTVNFTASATCTSAGVAVASPPATSGNVTIVPNGDLVIKRALDSPNDYAGAGVFQTIPIPPQIKTNFVFNTGDVSTFQVQIQNNDPNPQIFTLNLNSLGNLVWQPTFLLSGVDVTAQFETPNGLTLPAMASNTSLVLTVSVQDTNASPGDLNGVVITLGLASDPTVTLDAVEALTQLIPDGDLLIKRDADPASLYAGQDIFQTVQAYPQIKTNLVALNQDSKFQVQIQNTTTQAQSFALAAMPSGNGGWLRTYLLGTQDMTSQLEASGGANLPQVAPGNSLTLAVITRATNAPPGDVKRIDFTLALASAPTLTLDAVEAVSQVGPPDLAVVSMAWNNTNSGLDFVYTNRGSALTNATLAQVFWASGPTTNDILFNLQPIYTAHIPAGFNGQATNQVSELYFDWPPTNATSVQVLLDPDNLVTETTKTNNALALPLTFRHVVLVMMENRSFDHFLGWLPGAIGKQAGLVFTNALGQAYATHDLAPYYQGCGCLLPDQAFGAYTEFDNGLCDGWLRANPNDTYTIGYYSQADLPFWGQVAPNWTVCDHYFAPLMAETQPNRIYQHAAQTDALSNRNFAMTITGTIALAPITLPTIWDTLMQSNVSGSYYHEGIGPQQTILTLWGIRKYFFTSLVKSINDFYDDCEAATLPSVSFVDPLFTAPSWAAVVTGNDTVGNDYHPHADIRNGEAFLTRIYNAIASSPQWSSTVLIINFDEWGGFYDHVVPPIGPVTPEEYNLGNFGQLGFRVPCMIISPWAKRATVNSMQFDHTSVLKLIEDRWGLPALARRDQAANDLTNAMDFTDPPNYSIPAIDSTFTNNAPFGGSCEYIQLVTQPNGTLAAVWDATCLKVILQTSPTINAPDGLWTDQPDSLTPPYVFAPLDGSGRTLFIRFKVVGSGYVTPPL